MKTIRLSLIAALALVLVAGFAQRGDRYAFQTQSKLWVEGTSSIHDWKCEAGQLSGFVKNAPDARPGPASAITSTSLDIPVKALECGNGTMNRKMRDALKADAAPVVRYQLDEAKVLSTGAGGTVELQTKGRLTIAGKQQPVQMKVNAQELPDGSLRFKGSQPIMMSDFGIAPPTAMLGTLKTGDKVVVHFDVVTAREQ